MRCMAVMQPGFSSGQQMVIKELWRVSLSARGRGVAEGRTEVRAWAETEVCERG